MQKNITYNAESYKIAFLAALFLIGAIAVYGWFVVPHQNYIKATQNYESAVSNLSKKKQVISNNLKAGRIKSEKLQKQLSEIQGKIFDLPEEREFFSNIENDCEQTGCKMLSLTLSQSSLSDSKPDRELMESKSVTASSANLSFMGKYGDIVTMMNKLQGSSKLVRFKSISINTVGDKPGYLKCDMIITIYVTNKEKEL
ncbi:MAG: hypothetical protein JXA96_10540 [Sedimentisphaerales bacterium]|nr:hypothetical protein [Sedimentisphaerales bacterium]